MRWRIVITVLAAAVACLGGIVVAASAASTDRTPALLARPRAAAPGESIMLFGSGFAPLARIVLLAGTPDGVPTRIGAAKTDRDGRFRAPIRIAARVVPGRYVAFACRHSCRVRASAGFRVLEP